MAVDPLICYDTCHHMQMKLVKASPRGDALNIQPYPCMANALKATQTGKRSKRLRILYAAAAALHFIHELLFKYHAYIERFKF